MSLIEKGKRFLVRPDVAVPHDVWQRRSIVELVAVPPHAPTDEIYFCINIYEIKSKRGQKSLALGSQKFYRIPGLPSSKFSNYFTSDPHSNGESNWNSYALDRFKKHDTSVVNNYPSPDPTAYENWVKTPKYHVASNVAIY